MRDSTHKRTLDDNRVTAGKCGAIDAVVSAMKTHSGNAGVCEKGCGALKNIAFNNGKYHHTQNDFRDSTHKHTLADNKVTAGKCGAIEAIVSAMKTHLNNADVCQYGCWALQIIAVNGKCQHTQN